MWLGPKFTSRRIRHLWGCTVVSTRRRSGTSPNPKRTNAISSLFPQRSSRRALASPRFSWLAELLRDYFYRLPNGAEKESRPNLYEMLRIPASASPAELRVAFKLRNLELAGATKSEQVALERAFNILGQPELRACYDALLADPEAPAAFPYGGFGSLLVSGERSRDGRTFFAQHILSFSPELKQRRFHLPVRQCDFYENRALCRDVRRKLEFWLDPAVLHTLWDPTWNQWKHLLAAKMEVDATFVSSGKYRKRRGEWELDRWETALPSRLAVKLPSDFQQQVETARATHRRFGQYSRALEQIRLRLEYHAIEKTELERACSALRMPGDFDISQINWRVDYDPFFYRQLARRARRIYLFRDEYIFDVEKAVVIETPQLGHATYVFAKPRNMDSFLARVHQDHEGRHSAESRQRRREAGILGPRDPRQQSQGLAQRNPATRGREDRLRLGDCRLNLSRVRHLAS